MGKDIKKQISETKMAYTDVSIYMKVTGDKINSSIIFSDTN